MNFKISFQLYKKKNLWDFDGDYIDSAKQFGENCYLNNIESSDLQSIYLHLFHSSLISLGTFHSSQGTSFVRCVLK